MPGKVQEIISRNESSVQETVPNLAHRKYLAQDLVPNQRLQWTQYKKHGPYEPHAAVCSTPAWWYNSMLSPQRRSTKSSTTQYELHDSVMRDICRLNKCCSARRGTTMIAHLSDYMRDETQQYYSPYDRVLLSNISNILLIPTATCALMEHMLLSCSSATHYADIFAIVTIVYAGYKR